METICFLNDSEKGGNSLNHNYACMIYEQNI
jgi:hypothetical protein